MWSVAAPRFGAGGMGCGTLASGGALGHRLAPFVRISVAAAIAAVALAIAARLHRPRHQKRRDPPIQLPRDDVPADYRAAGVIFFRRGVGGAVSKVLLGVEERRVRLKELCGGSPRGSAQRQVLLFPQGKREDIDADFVDTARREFVEETADPWGLSGLLLTAGVLGPQRAQLPIVWFEGAKMAVIFCDVTDLLGVDDAQSVLAPAAFAGASSEQQLPMRPVWVETKELLRALSSSHQDEELDSGAGKFPLFPLARRFFRSAHVARWLAGSVNAAMAQAHG